MSLCNELSYTFGGCTVSPMQGKYRSVAGAILPDKINVLFTDTPFVWAKDRLLVEQYAAALHQVIHQVLADEEAILITAYPIYHVT